MDRDAPLINALVTRPNGLPGSGFGDFYDEYLRKSGERKWEKLGEERQLEVVADIRAEVRGYAGWDAIYHKLYGENPPQVAKPKRFTPHRSARPLPPPLKSSVSMYPDQRKLRYIRPWPVLAYAWGKALDHPEQPPISAYCEGGLFSSREHTV